MLSQFFSVVFVTRSVRFFIVVTSSLYSSNLVEVGGGSLSRIVSSLSILAIPMFLRSSTVLATVTRERKKKDPQLKYSSQFRFFAALSVLLTEPSLLFLCLAPMASSRFCSPRFLAFLVLLSAIPIGIIISMELAKPPTHVYHYHSTGWFRECAKWDEQNRRFIVAFFEGGIGQIPVSGAEGEVLEEIPVVKDADLAGNASLGIVIDRPRNRLLAVHADAMGNRYGALAVYDLSTWKRLFLTQLSGPSDERSLPDDVAVDAEGNAYVTDAKASKIWKVGAEGTLMSIIRNPLFVAKEWYKNLVALNGIVYHPNGYLIVIHTFSGNLFKIDLSSGKEEVKLIKVEGGPLSFGDGLELVSPTKLVVAGNPSGRLVESSDGWETASVAATFWGLKHRLATAATVKDGKVYLNHMIGMGYPKRKHAFVEAKF